MLKYISWIHHTLWDYGMAVSYNKLWKLQTIKSEPRESVQKFGTDSQYYDQTPQEQISLYVNHREDIRTWGYYEVY